MSKMHPIFERILAPFAPPKVERKIVTHFWMKPIPIRSFDWIAYYDGDEPNDNGQMPHGYGATEAEAIADLKTTTTNNRAARPYLHTDEQAEGRDNVRDRRQAENPRRGKAVLGRRRDRQRRVPEKA